MEVIVIETQAFYNLLESASERAYRRIKEEMERENADRLIPEDEVMRIFGIGSRTYFRRFISKNNIPFARVGRGYHYRKIHIDDYLKRKQKKLKV
jgi:predicted DNA-binding transcriptional regulator AlpA